MSESFILSCCSTVDLTADILAERNIHYTSLHYRLDDKEYTDDLFQSMSADDFYLALKNGADSATAQVNVEEYRAYFEQFLQNGQDVLHVTLSSGLSGSYNSARIAAELLAEQYPERKLRIVDSLGAASGSGLILITLADLRDEGRSIDEVADWAEENKLHMHHWFFSSDLTFFIKGGRVTKAAGWFGTALKICPVLNMDNLGRLIPRFKMRGKRNAIKEMVRQMEEHATNGKAYADRCYICHSDCIEDAKAVAELVESQFPQLPEPVQIYSIGPTIGSHTGPGTVALFFWGDKREN